MKGIGINGYGTIGKRVADAVTAQDDIDNNFFESEIEN